LRGFGGDRQLLSDHFLVIAVAWPKHHAMVTKNDGHAVPVKSSGRCSGRPGEFGIRSGLFRRGHRRHDCVG
jgi:hypothetical protein